MHPLITDQTRNSDPWQRNYYQPPDLKPFVPRSYPLIDIRPELSKRDSSPSEILKQYGFSVVKHQSPFVDELGKAPIEDENHIAIYHREVQDLAKRTLGAKEAFITTRVVRLGARTPGEMKLPTGLRSAAEKNPDLQGGGGGAKADEMSIGRHLTGQASLTRSAPIRVPHMDLTPLGARQLIRHQAQDIRDAAAKAGVLAWEDEICNDQPFSAPTKEADALIDAKYNVDGKLGPRYAAYSIWRPLCKVVRDPITLGPRGKTTEADAGLVFWAFNNKIPGPKELGGDFLKEYAMLGVKEEEEDPERVANNSLGNSLKWYYVSDQQPNEVLFIQLFDSASLGTDSLHAKTPWHGSPEIDAVDDDHPRESIEVRVMDFW